MNEIDKCYIELVIAIIEQAVKDYKKALKDCDDKSRIVQAKAQSTKRECEKFFLSEWGQLLTDGHGQLIIERCRREVAEEKKAEEKKRSDLNG